MNGVVLCSLHGVEEVGERYDLDGFLLILLIGFSRREKRDCLIDFKWVVLFLACGGRE